MKIGNEELTHQNVWPTDVVKSPLFTKLGSSWEIEVGQKKTFLFGCLPLEEEPLHGSWHGSGRGFQSTLSLLCYSSHWMFVLLPLEGAFVPHSVAEQLQEVPGSIQGPTASAGFKKTTWRWIFLKTTSKFSVSCWTQMVLWKVSEDWKKRLLKRVYGRIVTTISDLGFVLLHILGSGTFCLSWVNTSWSVPRNPNWACVFISLGFKGQRNKCDSWFFSQRCRIIN